MRLVVAMVAALIAPMASAQQPPPTWSVTLDIPGRGEIRELAIADNGDIVVAGYIDRGVESIQASKLDGWLARYSADGALIWEKRIGGEYRDEVAGLAIAPDGSIYIAGPQDIRLTQSIKHSASYVSRYTGDGTLMWHTSIDAPDGPQVWLTSMRLLDDGSALVVGGMRWSWEGTDSEAYVARISATGERLWQQWPAPYENDAELAALARNGQTFRGLASIVQQHGRLGRIGSDNTVELFATYPSMEGPSPARCVVIELAYGHRSDAACGPMDDLAINMNRAAAPFTAGRNGGVGTGDGYVRKYDEAGQVVWEFAPPSDDGDGFNAVTSSADGGAIAAGYRLHGNDVFRHNWDGLLLKLDRAGNLEWQREFDGGARDELNGVAELDDGSVIVVGYTTPNGSDVWKPWIMRLNPDGQLE